MSVSQVVRYRFDNFMARGGRSIFTSLTVVFVTLLIGIFALRWLFYHLMPDAPSQHAPGVLTNLYVTFLQMTDPGNMAQDIESSPWFKVPSVLSGLAGIIMLSALIAFITTALDRKLNELKKGHSKVIESGHTLILGWNEQRITEILRELIEANESEERPAVVILADTDKEAMDDYLALYVRDTRNTRVITRSGMPSSLVNLQIASVAQCKAVIVLAECQETAAEAAKATSDAKVIKTVLAVHAALGDQSEGNIVAEVFHSANQRVAENIWPGNVTVIEGRDILAKILVQTSRSVGLSAVYNEVLSFEGCEMYFYQADWGPVSFGELAFHFPDGVPMGLRHADGRLSLNPPPDLTVAHDDAVLILAEDNDTIAYQPRPVAEPRTFPLREARLDQVIERELIIGWTNKIGAIVREYADYVLEGSAIELLPRAVTEDIRCEFTRLQEEVPGIRLSLLDRDAFNTDDLLAINPFEYDNILILSPAVAEGEEDRADSETIVQLLMLRNIFASRGTNGTKLITEVLESENIELVSRSGVHDFVISNRLVSMLLAQISESKEIKAVYDDLFSEEGSEIYLKPASLYLDSLPTDMSFADMMRLAQQRGEVCLGVKVKAFEKDAARNFGITLIPEKNTRYTLAAEDALVVLAEDET